MIEHFGSRTIVPSKTAPPRDNAPWMIRPEKLSEDNCPRGKLPPPPGKLSSPPYIKFSSEIIAPTQVNSPKNYYE